MQNTRELLSIGQASEYLGISIDTLRRWEKRSKLTTFRSPGGHRYFDKKDLDELFGTKYERDEVSGFSISTKKEKLIETEIKPIATIAYNNFDLPYSPPPKPETKSDISESERPAKEINVPPITPIKITQNTPISPETAYYEQQKVGILIPPASFEKPTTEKKVLPDKSIITNKKIKISISFETLVIIFLSIIALIIIIFLILYLTNPKPGIISPIPQ